MSIESDIDNLIMRLEQLQASLKGQPVLGSVHRHYPHQFLHGDWDCSESPTGSCMYTRAIGYDCCIFCEEPDERK